MDKRKELVSVIESKLIDIGIPATVTLYLDRADDRFVVINIYNATSKLDFRHKILCSNLMGVPMDVLSKHIILEYFSMELESRG